MRTKEWIARNIRTVARARDMQLKDLCEQIDMSEAVFYKRLKGGSEWKIEELAAIADRLETSVDRLLGDPSDLLTTGPGWVTGDDARDMVAA